jgi:cytochrome c-type biogenesis protein CcmE
MNPTRKRRLWLVLALFAAGATATGLVSLALQRNVAYLYTPNEVLTGKAGARVATGDTRFRLGGMVAANSFRRAEGSMEAHFEVSDGDAKLPVVFTGILPDLFREQQAVVATGRMRDGVFVAEEVLAKHDETYVPKEVADKMGLAHKKHGVVGADGTFTTAPTFKPDEGGGAAASEASAPPKASTY